MVKMPQECQILIYINEGNFNFTEKLVPNNELSRETLRYGIVTGDYDLDGQLDIYMGGVNILNDTYARVLLNKNMDFTDANLQIRSSPNMSNFWADYDYDGDLDIYSVTSYASPDKTRLYLNNNGTLEEIIIDLGAQHKMDLPFMAVNLDNKNGLDFLMKINGGDYNQYYDNWGSSKRLSAAPANTRYEQDKLDIILHWDKVSDCPGCTYNIRVGTQSNNVNIMSPMSDLSTGYRYVVQQGNAYLNNGWRLSDLPVGTYYWSVQAVDPANTGGPWAPVASFTVSQINAEFSYTTVCLKDTTIFNDLSVATNAVIKWKWEFGDGIISTLQNPEHSYANAGTFNAGLWAYSESGDSAYKSHSVTVKAIPVTDFTADIACQGTLTSFTNNTATNGLTISNWLWSFGDGLSSTSQDPSSHGYLNTGEYTAELWAFAANGCNSSVQKTVKVGLYPSVAVTADAPFTFCSGDSVTLSVPYVSTYTYQWKLDGTPITNAGSGSFVAHQSGSYTVEVINPIGNCSKTSDPKSVSVQAAPVSPLINASGSLTFCEGDSVVLSATDNPAYTYQWKLNSGAMGSNSNQFIAKNSGTYNLTVLNSNGCSVPSSNSVNVVVNSLPTASAVGLSGPTQFCEGGSVTLSITATSGDLYNWRNEYGLIAGANTNSYLATSSGNYQLDISNASGCVTKTTSANVVVKPMPIKPAIDKGNYQEGKCLNETPIRLNVKDVVSEYNYQWYKNGVPISSATSSYLEGFLPQADYSLESDLGGCKSQSDILNVYFEDAPEKPLIYAQGPTVWYLACSNDSATQYKWYYNGTLISGADKYLYVANQKLGKYNVSISNAKGCFTLSDTLKIPTGSTGIEDIDPFEGLKIYPNPTSGMFTIEMDNQLFGELMISILDQGGKKILNIKFEKTTEHFSSQIDLSGQSKGMYLINLLLDKYLENRKIIVE
jgi:PKD repeat protein